jgi:glucose-1-phosphate cytidylyltransferase
MENYGSWNNDRNVVTSFDEKPSSSLINGGFMIMEPEFIRKYLIDDMGTYQLESEALPAAARHGKMQAHVHTGYWRCMDTRRDLEQIEADVIAGGGKMPWMREIG